MTDPTLHAATSLADVLARENAALRGMDFPGAMALLAEKTQALAALAAALAAAADGPAPRPMAPTRMVESLARDLPALIADNRHLLETALHVQTRLIGLIAHAASQQARLATPRYGARGGFAAARPGAIAVSARA